MKNKKDLSGDFRIFKRKMFTRTVVMVLFAIIGIHALYTFVLHRRFANWIVSFFQSMFRIDYDAARDMYFSTFRGNIELIFLLAGAVVFFMIFRIYLRWFTEYFKEINVGIDSLSNENTAEVSLSAELLPTERRLNSVKHTIERQKRDILDAEQKKNDLVMYLAHDLKTPLASVIGYLNLLSDSGDLPPELREKYISIALEKADRLEDLINEFFDIARFNLSSITLQYGDINLTMLLEQLIYEFSPMLSEKNMKCLLDAERDIRIRCDSDKILRVFDNILRNAVFYGASDSEIEISAHLSGENARVSFKNRGDTIPSDKLERIFEQFYRLDTSRSTKSGGAGLGLAIAKQITELHGGFITAVSCDGITEFDVVLPTKEKNNIK